MQLIIIKLFKGLKLLRFKISAIAAHVYCNFLFYVNGVNVKSFKCLGIPYIHKSIKPPRL